MLRKLTQQIVAVSAYNVRAGTGSVLDTGATVRSHGNLPMPKTRSLGTTTATVPMSTKQQPRFNLNLINSILHSEPIHPIQEVLNLTPIRTDRILQNCPELRSFGFEALKESFDFLVKDVGVSVALLVRVPGLLTLSKEKLQTSGLDVMTRLKIQDFRCTLPFLLLPEAKLSRIEFIWKKELKKGIISSLISDSDLKDPKIQNRMDVLALKLETDACNIADMMSRVEGLITAPLDKLVEKINLLIEHGISQDDIVKDPWILLNSLQSMKARLEQCRSSKIHTIKPWMLRCTQLAFNGYVMRLCQERQLLNGHSDIGGFLTARLKCSKSTSQEILSRVSSVKTASASKLDEMISFLYSHGFTRDHILEAPRILGHSVETVKSRIKELEDLGYRPFSLYVLCYTSKHYETFVQKLKMKETQGQEQ